MTRRAPVIAALLVASGAARSARAAVTEPNGVSVPATVANGETTLQQFFTMKGEAIDATADANTDPAVFLPLCDFQATLVLSQSHADTGLAWYNKPADATSKPTLYQIGTAALQLNQAITSASIRSDPNYAGGLIGFALLKNYSDGRGWVPIYYSEYMRNVLCSQCTPMPGYWKMMLSYQSKTASNSYYLAWEDWEGANQSSWPDDGDFNDKVFQVTGVTCNGGGQPCDTGMLGVCSAGITECQVGGTISCKPRIAPTAEKCDNLDNDCDGMIDDGPNLCDEGRVCVQGTCVAPCGITELDCVPPYTCSSGLCIETTCVGKTCPAGQVCRHGSCVGGCQGVVCPIGQECQLGVCIDPCAGVSCPGGVCERGVCVTKCGCRACATGEVCADSGQCVDTGCNTMTCGAGQVCKGGACHDPCDGAVCPGGAGCHNGACDPPMTGQTGGTGAGGGAGSTTVTGVAGTIGTTGRAGTTGGGARPDAGAVTGVGGSGGSSGGAGPQGRGGTVACGCALADRGGGLALALLAAAALAVTARRRPRRR